MGKPAARLGDMTAHAGSIVVGCPTVLIGGMPAARIGDMHVCPLFNPGTPPPPHVGGPVAMGSPTVLIGGMPAARVGDMVTCAGPPDTIAMGCFTVLIGESGSGSGGGGGGGGAAAAAQAGVATATIDNLDPLTKQEHWIEFEFVDKAGNPVSGIPYKFTGPDGSESESMLRPDGKIRRDALPSGQGKVQLFSLYDAKWSKDKANVGEKVKLSAQVEGYENGTPALFQIYERDVKGPDDLIANIEAKVQGNKVEAEWEYVYTEDDEATVEETQRGYSAPEYYFEVILGRSKARSGMLAYKDWIEIELLEEGDKPVANQEYRIVLPNGEIRMGRLDSNGYAKVEKIPPGDCKIDFPGGGNSLWIRENTR
jgi:uncharacterized Zn-binding protein involved in type VI secretion